MGGTVLGRRFHLLPKIFLPLADGFCSLVIYVEEGFAFSHTLIHQGISSLGFLRLWYQGISYCSLRVARKVWATRDLFCGELFFRVVTNQNMRAANISHSEGIYHSSHVAGVYHWRSRVIAFVCGYATEIWAVNHPFLCYSKWLLYKGALPEGAVGEAD